MIQYSKMGKGMKMDDVMMRMENMDKRMDIMQMMMESQQAERSLHHDDHMK